MNRQLIFVFILIMAMLGIAISNVSKPDAGLLKFVADGPVAYGYGTTNDMSIEMTRNFLNDHPEVRTLVLKKMPGTVDGDANTKLARLIRKRGLNTHLDRNSFIASGAVDLFIAGIERTMDCGAAIGVHSWSYGAPEGSMVEGRPIYPGNIGSDPYQKAHEDFLSDMGIDPEFYLFTRSAALPTDLHFMTATEIKQWGLLTQPANCD